MEIPPEWLKKHYKTILILSVLTFISVILLHFSLNFGVGFGDENFYLLASEEIIENNWIIPPWMKSVYYGHEGAIGEPLAKPPLSFYIPAVFYSLGYFKAYSAIFSILTIALVFHVGKKFYGYWAGLFAAIALAGIPLFIDFSVIAYTETMIAFFVLFSAYMIFQSFSKNSRVYLLAAGGVLGVTFLVKEIAFLLLPVFVIFLAVQKYRGQYKTGSLKKLAIIFIIGMAIVTPWFARNWYYFQNPMFPQFRPIFGSEHTDLLGWEILESQARVSTLEMFNLGAFLAHFSVFLYAAIVGLVFLVYRRKSVDILIAIAALVFTSGIFMFGISDIRYLFSGIPFLALAAGVVMDNIFKGKDLNKFVHAGGVLVVLWLCFSFLSVTYVNSERIANRVRVQGSYIIQGLEWIVENTEEDAVIYDLWVHEVAYFTGRTTTYSNVYSGGHNLYYWWTRPEAEARKNLEGIDYVMVELYLFGAAKGAVWTYTPWEALQYMGQHPGLFRQVFRGDGVVIFEVLK